MFRSSSVLKEGSGLTQMLGVGGGSRRSSLEGSRRAPAGASPIHEPEPYTAPVTVQFLNHLTARGGYGLDEDSAVVGVRQWREAEIIGTLVRNVMAKAPDAILGRIFTAVNQDGLVVLIGEASEPDDWAYDSINSAASPSNPVAAEGVAGAVDERLFITDCHLSVCTLEPPVNLGAPDGRMAHAVILVMVPEDDLTAPWAEGLDRFTTMRTIKSAFKRFAAHGGAGRGMRAAKQINW